MDKNWNKARLDELAADFGSAASRRKLVQEFGDYPDALWGNNENGEKVMLSIRKDGLTERVYQPEPEELELSDAQIARNDEIYNVAFDFCKVMAEDDNLEWNMEILGQLADFAAELLTTHGSRVRFPSVVTEPDDTQHIEEYYGEES